MKNRLFAIVVLVSTAVSLVSFAVANAASDPTSTAAPSADEALIQAVPRAYDLRITAYASVPDETDDTPFITANGTYVHDGIVASNMLPFGTKVMIPNLFGDKIFIVEDRMAPYFKKSIDIWMPSVNQALRFGVQRAMVVIVPPGITFSESMATTSATTLASIVK
ncbi:MAG TPA: hypothetical protein VMU07_03435 [Candidatus Paceibacterota bacterium]|nr:hypothetical protein [Candidatus Paceibacterota bacterium]